MGADRSVPKISGSTDRATSLAEQSNPPTRNRPLKDDREHHNPYLVMTIQGLRPSSAKFVQQGLLSATSAQQSLIIKVCSARPLLDIHCPASTVSAQYQRIGKVCSVSPTFSNVKHENTPAITALCEQGQSIIKMAKLKLKPSKPALQKGETLKCTERMTKPG
ncbi:hypothetical protein U1Q18_001347 [Sarracenia purpurea var. burkii]